MPKLNILDWGLIAYDKAQIQQEEILKEIVDQKLLNRDLNQLIQHKLPESYLIFCQHSPVYTLGNSGSTENLLLDETELSERGIEYYRIRRGGDITFHGPGQLVGYPILDLDQFFTDIHRYLRLLEETIILTLDDLGIRAGRISGLTGVWVGFEEPESARKICAIGVRCSRWVTMHGFALNANTDLSYFENIIPCGIKDKAVTSIEKELGYQVELQEVQQAVKKNFVQIFGVPEALSLS